MSEGVQSGLARLKEVRRRLRDPGIGVREWVSVLAVRGRAEDLSLPVVLSLSGSCACGAWVEVGLVTWQIVLSAPGWLDGVPALLCPRRLPEVSGVGGACLSRVKGVGEGVPDALVSCRGAACHGCHGSAMARLALAGTTSVPPVPLSL